MNATTIHKAPHRWPLVVIALDKFLKAAGLIIVSFFLTPQWRKIVLDWANNPQLTPHNPLIADALHGLARTLGFLPQSLHLVRLCVILYACLYVIEGAGLFYERKWAEWMVVLGTAAYLPLEIYNFIREPRWTMVVVFLLNLFMTIYLLWRLRRQSVIRRELAEHPELAARKPAPDPQPHASQPTAG